MKASLRAILWNDWPALAFWLGIPIMWVIYFAFPMINGSKPLSGSYAVFLPVVSTALLVGLLAWRVLRVRALFERGVEVPGEIRGVLIARDRGRLEYTYQWGEETLVAWSPVHKTERVLGFSFRQPVRVLVDASDPKKSVVRELFA